MNGFPRGLVHSGEDILLDEPIHECSRVKVGGIDSFFARDDDRFRAGVVQWAITALSRGFVGDSEKGRGVES